MRRIYIAIVWFFNKLRSSSLRLMLRRRDPSKYPQKTSLNHFLNKVLYELMIQDKPRNEAYQKAIQSKVKSSSKVLEIGTGDFAFLSKMILAQNPEKLTTIELNEESFYSSKQELANAIKEDQSVEMLQGNSLHINLEQKHDLLVHEILGSIGSAESAVLVLEDAKKRHLTPDAECIPKKCSTLVAPVEKFKFNLFEKLLHLVSFGTTKMLPDFYRVYNAPLKALLSPPQVFECIDFYTINEHLQNESLSFVIQKDALLDGVLLYMDIDFDQGLMVNTLKEKTNWSTPYIKILTKPIQVCKGDQVVLNIEKDFTTSDPSYHIKMNIEGSNGPHSGEFSWSSRNRWEVQT